MKLYTLREHAPAHIVKVFCREVLQFQESALQVSAELRWFWEGNCPPEVTDWFTGSRWTASARTEQRTDEYFLMRGNTEIGCKIRGEGEGEGNGTEVKALITRLERNGIELWGKWNWFMPADVRRVKLYKERQFRLCSAFLPDAEMGATISGAKADDACRIELTQVRVDGFDNHWWTLALEAWGDVTSAPLALARSFDVMHLPFISARLCNYPQFLNDLVFSDHVDLGDLEAVCLAYNRATKILTSEEWQGWAGEIARTGEEDPLALVDDPDLREIVAAKMELRRSQEACFLKDLGQVRLRLGERLRKAETILSDDKVLLQALAEIGPGIINLIDNSRMLSTNSVYSKNATISLLWKFCDLAEPVVVNCPGIAGVPNS